jgi:hypothetical protein
MEDGISLVIGGTAVGAVLTFFGQILAARVKQTNKIEPNPLNVQAVDRYMRCEDCLERHRVVDKRHDELVLEIRSDRQNISEQLGGIRKALSENDRKAEERSVNLHKRIDPLVAAIGGSKEAIENHLQDHRSHNNGGATT